MLYEYILHRIYKFELRHKPNLFDKDSYFVPAGYDSAAMLKDFDMQEDLKLLYEERVPPVKPKNVYKEEEEVVCEDLNNFLGKFRDKNRKQDRHISNGYGTNSMTETDLRTSLSDKKINREEYTSTSSAREKPSFDIFYGSNKTSSVDVGPASTSNKTLTGTEKFVIIILRLGGNKEISGSASW